MLVSPEGEEGSKAEPGLSQQAEAAPEGAGEEPSEALPSSVSADEVAEPLPEPSGDGSDRALAFVPVAVPDVPVSAAVPQAEPSCGHEMEERIIRLEEALSRLNERVVALEQRADGAAEQDLNVSAISGDIQSLLTEGNALCGQLKSLAAELGSTPSGVSAEAPEAAPLPGSSAEVAEEPTFPPVPSRSAEIPWESSSPEADPDDGPDVLGLALESLERRLALLESRPCRLPTPLALCRMSLPSSVWTWKKPLRSRKLRPAPWSNWSGACRSWRAARFRSLSCRISPTPKPSPPTL